MAALPSSTRMLWRSSLDKGRATSGRERVARNGGATARRRDGLSGRSAHAPPAWRCLPGLPDALPAHRPLSETKLPNQDEHGRADLGAGVRQRAQRVQRTLEAGRCDVEPLARLGEMLPRVDVVTVPLRGPEPKAVGSVQLYSSPSLEADRQVVRLAGLCLFGKADGAG